LVEKQKFRLAIQLSGFSKQEKKVLQTSIEILGGRYYSSPVSVNAIPLLYLSISSCGLEMPECNGLGFLEFKVGVSRWHFEPPTWSCL